LVTAAVSASLPAQPDERGMEGGNVLAQQLGGVALRVHRHEQHLHLGSAITQLAHRLGHVRKLGRAHVGAMGEPEDDDDDLAAEVRQRSRSPLVVLQAQRAAAHLAAGHVDAGERALRGPERVVAAGQDQGCGRERRSEAVSQAHPASSGR
jgi:hypothetical protein